MSKSDAGAFLRLWENWRMATTQTKVRPEHAGAYRCYQCVRDGDGTTDTPSRPVVACQSTIEYDRHGDQIGVRRMYLCAEHTVLDA